MGKKARKPAIRISLAFRTYLINFSTFAIKIIEGWQKNKPPLSAERTTHFYLKKLVDFWPSSPCWHEIPMKKDPESNGASIFNGTRLHRQRIFLRMEQSPWGAEAFWRLSRSLETSMNMLTSDVAHDAKWPGKRTFRPLFCPLFRSPFFHVPQITQSHLSRKEIVSEMLAKAWPKSSENMLDSIWLQLHGKGWV